MYYYLSQMFVLKVYVDIKTLSDINSFYLDITCKDVGLTLPCFDQTYPWIITLPQSLILHFLFFFSFEQHYLVPIFMTFSAILINLNFPGASGPPPPHHLTPLDPPCRNHQSYTHVWYDKIQLNVHTMFIHVYAT